ncbi:MAG: GFA family protein [Betaproteobacteria bacterium]|jgi:hypothetical protein
MKGLNMKVTGACFCGAISFRAVVDPTRVIACHCKDCQIFSGAPFRAVVPTPVADVEVSGTAKHYVKVAESGNRRIQAFCGECGSHLWATEGDGEPKTMNLRTGCIEQGHRLVPTAQVWSHSAVPWLDQLPSVPAHTKGPSSPLNTGSSQS